MLAYGPGCVVPQELRTLEKVHECGAGGFFAQGGGEGPDYPVPCGEAVLVGLERFDGPAVLQMNLLYGGIHLVGEILDYRIAALPDREQPILREVGSVLFFHLPLLLALEERAHFVQGLFDIGLLAMVELVLHPLAQPSEDRTFTSGLK